MRVVLTSDTHNGEPALPRGDVLIHAGDSCLAGTEQEFERFCKWMHAQASKFEKILYVPGNHDVFAQVHRREAELMIAEAGVQMLVDEETEVKGLRVWGSPWIPPTGGDWAWEARSEARDLAFAMIPEGLDILVTHAAPTGPLSSRWGCDVLARHVKRAKPKVHVFGHIHEHGGEAHLKDEILYMNAAFGYKGSPRKAKPRVLCIAPSPPTTAAP